MAGLRLGQALALGLLHGPAELLPISSSGHITVVPWLLGWEYQDAQPEVRKSFEVALHAGTAAALLITLREDVTASLRGASPRLLGLIALSFLPPASAGYLLESPIERHLGKPGSVATGMAIGAAAMLVADRSPAERTREQATAADALWLGAAQTLALIPGVSRNGATLAAARLRRFRRPDANVLSRHVALPIIAAATGRRLWSALREAPPRRDRAALVAGTAAAFISTLGSTWIIGRVERHHSLAPYALYRLSLAGLVARRLMSASGGQ